jgi:hypothetical protein
MFTSPSYAGGQEGRHRRIPERRELTGDAPTRL